MTDYMERYRYWIQRADEELIKDPFAKLHVTREEFEEMKDIFRQIQDQRMKHEPFKAENLLELAQHGSHIHVYNGMIEIVVDEDEEKEVPFNWENEVSDG